MLQNPEEQERSFECRTCDRSFARLEHLQRHLRTHTKERPYACFCGRTFTRQDLLKRHGRRAHEASAEVSGRATPVANGVSQYISLSDDSTVTASASRVQTFARSDFHQNKHEIQQHGNVPVSLLADPSIPDTIDAARNGDNQPGDHPATAADRQTSLDNYLGLFDSGDLDLDWNNMGLAETEAQDLMEIQADPGTLLIDIPVDLSAELQDSGVSKGCDTTQSPPDMFEVQARYHEQLQLAIHQHLPFFLVPSNHSIMRYLDGFVEGFNQDFPFIHVPTLTQESCNPELILAMAAIGAYQRFERPRSLELFHASKTIALSNLHTWQANNGQKVQNLILEGSEIQTPDDLCGSRRHTVMEGLRALLLLSFYGLLGESAAIPKDILEFQSLMINFTRHYGFSEQSESSTTTASWYDWVDEESDRRTKSALFCFLNLQTVIHNIPSPILCSEWQLRMPCSAEEWEVGTESEWIAKRARTQPIAFQDNFRSLLSPVDYSKTEPFQNSSGFSSTILILALLQRIYYVRQLNAATGDTLGEETIQQLQRAIQFLDSIYVPSPSISFSRFFGTRLQYGDIIAYQDLAYVRLHTDLGIHGQLQSRDPQEIARSLYVASQARHGAVYPLLPLWRSIDQLKAAVNLGIAYVSHVPEHLSSVPQALSVLECGVFLSRWLFSIASKGCEARQPLEELQAIHCLQSTMEEIAASVPEIGMAATSTATCFQLGIMVLKTWAHVLTAKTRWPLVAILGKSLDLCADMTIAANSGSEAVHLQQAV